jgi:hypothetical protein
LFKFVSLLMNKRLKGMGRPHRLDALPTGCEATGEVGRDDASQLACIPFNLGVTRPLAS